MKCKGAEMGESIDLMLRQWVKAINLASLLPGWSMGLFHRGS
jgi:hypothetical protein